MRRRLEESTTGDAHDLDEAAADLGVDAAELDTLISERARLKRGGAHKIAIEIVAELQRGTGIDTCDRTVETDSRWDPRQG